MNHIEIGERTRIISDGRNGVGAWVKTRFETGQEGEIIIGKNVGISNATLISQKHINARYGVVLEDEVQIGSHCSVYSVSTIDNKQGKVVLKKNCKIGSHSTVMPGVTIGENSIIGAHSLVTSDIPDNCIAVGVPAKVIKKISARS